MKPKQDIKKKKKTEGRVPGNDVDSGEKLMTGDKKCGLSLIVLVINPLIAPQIYMILNVR